MTGLQVRFCHLLLASVFCTNALADQSVTPGAGFDGDRYASLWRNSPFAIATPDAPVASTDYSLVGIAQFDGVFYASLIEKQSQAHFVLSSDKPMKNLTLVSITRGTGGNKTSAVIQRNGQPLTLTLDEAPASMPAGGAPGNPPVMVPPPPNQPAGANASVGGIMFQNPGGRPPRARVHRPPINIPPPPQ